MTEKTTISIDDLVRRTIAEQHAKIETLERQLSIAHRSRGKLRAALESILDHNLQSPVSLKEIARDALTADAP